MEEEKLSHIYYKSGCKAVGSGDYIPAKACFLEAINSGELSGEQIQTVCYSLAEINKKLEQYLESTAWFTKAILSGSEKAAEEFLDNSFLKEELLSVCSFIVLKYSGYAFNSLNLLWSDWYTNCNGGVKIISNSSQVDYKVIDFIFNLTKYDTEIALEFFEYCLFNKIIAPDIYRNIIFTHLMRAVLTDKVSYGLFLSFLLDDFQEAKNYLKKLSPEFLYSKFVVLQNRIEEIANKIIRDELNYMIFERFQANQDCFHDPDYCKAVHHCLEAISNDFMIPRKIIEQYVQNLYMINDHYDVLNIKQFAVKRLNEHPDKSSSLSTSLAMYSHNITDKDKMLSAIRHVIVLLENAKEEIEKQKREKSSIFENIVTWFGHHSAADEQMITISLNIAVDIVGKMVKIDHVSDIYLLLKQFQSTVVGKKSLCTDKKIVQIFNEIESILITAIKDMDKSDEKSYISRLG